VPENALPTYASSHQQCGTTQGEQGGQGGEPKVGVEQGQGIAQTKQGETI